MHIFAIETHKIYPANPLNMKLKTLLVSTALAIASVCSANAVVTTIADVSDNFNRTVGNQTSASSPNALNTEDVQYQIVRGTWADTGSYITGAANPSPTSPSIMYATNVQTQSTGNFDFALSVDILNVNSSSNPGDRMGGIVFNLQDSSNYYLLRTGNKNSALPVAETYFEFAKVVNGTLTVLDHQTRTGLTSQWYTISISSSLTLDNTFTYSFSDQIGGTLRYSNTVTDETFSNGYAGFWDIAGGGGGGRFDNFSLTVLQTVPEPSTVALFGVGMVGVLFLRNRARSRSVS